MTLRRSPTSSPACARRAGTARSSRTANRHLRARLDRAPRRRPGSHLPRLGTRVATHRRRTRLAVHHRCRWCRDHRLGNPARLRPLRRTLRQPWPHRRHPGPPNPGRRGDPGRRRPRRVRPRRLRDAAGWSYRSQWWYRHIDERVCPVARGAHGQVLYVDPANDLVIARFGSSPQAPSALLDHILIPTIDAITSEITC